MRNGLRAGWLGVRGRTHESGREGGGAGGRYTPGRGHRRLCAGMMMILAFDVAALLYWASLEPQKNLDELHLNLPRLASYLVASVVLFLVTFITAVSALSSAPRRASSAVALAMLSSSPSSSSSPFSARDSNTAGWRSAGRRPRSHRGLMGWAILIYGAVLLTGLLLFDQGNTLERHGGFNQLLFLVLFLPSLSLSLSIRCCWRGLSKRAFVWVWVVLVCTIVIFALVRFHRGRVLWPRGLGDSRLVAPSEEGCSIRPPDRNWEDLMPNGFMNCWTGFQSCSTQNSFAWLDEEEEVLTVECALAGSGLWSRLLSPKPSGAYSFWGAPEGTVWLLPRLEALNWREKGTGEIVLQKWVLDHMLNFTYPGRPVNLGYLENLRAWEHSDDPLQRAHAEEIAQGMRKSDLNALRERLDFRPEAFLVSCGSQTNLIFRNVRNEAAVERVREYHRALEAHQARPERPNFPKDKLNVMVVYLDAISRRQLHRKLPDTTAFLEQIKEGKWQNNVSSIFQFFKYHAIGPITEQNMRAMYMGDAVKARLRLLPKPAIWDHYRDHGYVTGLADNECEDKVARLANADTTWDHQFIPPFCLPEYLPVGDPHGNWVGPFALKARCMYGKQVHRWVLDYFGRFWRNYAPLPRFGVAALIEGHEGTGEVISLVDTDLAGFLRDAHLIDYNSTIVFLVSDHGHHMSLWWTLHMDSAVKENALPLLHMIAPNWLLRAYPDLERNLLRNQQRLVTGFDFHATLRHILLGDAATENEWQKKLPAFPLARSLFSEIAGSRDCSAAGIPLSMCQCTT